MDHAGIEYGVGPRADAAPGEMTMIRRAPLLVLLLLLALPFATARAGDDAPQGNFVQQALENVVLGPGLRSAQLILFPLLTKADPEPLPVAADLAVEDVAYEEPEFPQRRYDLFVGNGGRQTVLLHGGSVLVGGETDRMIPTDVLVPPQGEIEIHALPAAARGEKRKDLKTFRHEAALAPNYLREQALFEPTNERVRTFLSHFEEFFNPDDPRRSLAAVDESATLAQFCEACRKALSEFPQIGGRRVVGYISAVRGRVHAFELFGTNDLLKSYFGPGIRAHTYVAAAIALRAEKAGIPVPKDDDPAQTMLAVQAEAEELLARLAKASFRAGEQPKGSVGETLLVRATAARGAAVGLDGRLVHLTVFPHDPFETALFSRDLQIPEDVSEITGGGPGVPQLERGTAPGRRLTEYEQRLLDRMRRNRGGAPALPPR
jgi:hypothetical protein